MVIDINKYKYKKHRQKSTSGTVLMPVFERVFILDNKLIGEMANGKREIIQDYTKED